MNLCSKSDTIQQLQKDVLALQGYKRTTRDQRYAYGLGPIEFAFPNRTFPTGAVHEFLSYLPPDVAATNGFICGMLGPLMGQHGLCVWVGIKRTVFPAALKIFGIEPERIVFIDVSQQRDAMWVIEEALKCNTLSAVVGEVRNLSFTESRRLQLAVEQSRVTGFIHRFQPLNESPVACVSRWKVRPLTSIPEQGMPGMSNPHWEVQLQKVRNGRPGTWMVEWADGHFRHITRQQVIIPKIQTSQTG